MTVGRTGSRRERRSGRARRPRAYPPSAAPCRSRDSRTRRPPSAARPSRQRDAAFGDAARASASQRRPRRRREGVGIASARVRLISARSPLTRKIDVGLEPDDRIASAHFAAFDRFEQKAHRRACRRGRAGDLQKGGNRRFQIGDQRRPDHLRLAGRIALGERCAEGSMCILVGIRRRGVPLTECLRQRRLIDAGAEIVFQREPTYWANKSSAILAAHHLVAFACCRPNWGRAAAWSRRSRWNTIHCARLVARGAAESVLGGAEHWHSIACGEIGPVPCRA